MPIDNFYFCSEIASEYKCSINLVRRWAGGHNVYFDGRQYKWSLAEKEQFATELKNGFSFSDKWENEKNRAENLYNRIENRPTSSNLRTNEIHELQKSMYKGYFENQKNNLPVKQSSYGEKKSNNGCLIFFIIAI